MLQNHEKFIAFMVLVVAIVLLAALGTQVEAKEAGLRILDAAVVGLIGIAGMAAQSLFKHSKTEQDMAEALKTATDKTLPLTGEAREADEGKTEPWNRSE